MHAKVVSIQIFQYLHQIPPRVCTLVLFITSVLLYRQHFNCIINCFIKEENQPRIHFSMNCNVHRDVCEP